MAAEQIRSGFGLTRASTGLTNAHVGLIKMLAARAVADYLCEAEAEEQRTENDHDQEATA
ncbi:MAG: hypothetical protein Q8N04_03075 [Nitrospira sp.]|nr:hypothetical protein [Nitrospira sp.]